MSTRAHRGTLARPPDASLVRLLEWLHVGGARFPRVDVRLRPDGERGLFARSAIHPSEVLLEVPERFIVSVERARRSAMGRRLAKLGLQSLGEQVYLAVFLLCQRRMPRSFFRPFLDTLPAAFPHLPIYYGLRERALLQGSCTLEAIATRRALFQREYAGLRQHLPESAAFSLDEYLWARCTVSSRSFTLGQGAGRSQGLVPLADLLNHHAPAESDWEYDGGAGRFQVQAGEPVRPGQEIRISYGRKCNSRLFVNYGFALRDNPASEVRLLVPLAADLPALPFKRLVLAEAGLTEPVFLVSGQRGHRQTGELLSVMRFVHAGAQAAAALRAAPGFDVRRVPYLDRPTEAAALGAISAACTAALRRFTTTLEEDEALLHLPPKEGDGIVRTCVLVRRGEKRVLRGLLLRVHALRQDPAAPWAADQARRPPLPA